ncbi:hypothetical protein WA158_007119 [Blastocystis sp. Blastoise]
MSIAFGSRLQIPKTISRMVQAGMLGEHNPCSLMIDMTDFERRLNAVHTAFPEPYFKHCFAAKANPLRYILQTVTSLGGGVECATAGEVHQALHSGCPNNKIVFDSPLKLSEDFELCFKNGIHINFDNLQEVAKGQRIFEELNKQGMIKPADIGIRINPQLGAGNILMTSTATSTSKFGVPIQQYKQQILDTYKNWPQLTGLHIHVGSQGCPIDLFVKGARFIVDLAEEINQYVGREQVHTLDLGGGMPVIYTEDDAPLPFNEYSTKLRASVPELFTGKYTILTEFGRSMISKVGWFVSRCEYTKEAGDRHVIIGHAGGNCFTREVYMPDTWYHHISVYHPDGTPKFDNVVPTDVAGPLCFSGDLMCKNRPLPKIEQGDWYVIHDAGAYTISMYSRYNSCPAPSVHAYFAGDDNKSIVEIKKRETAQDVCEFWG